jgi:hypothetical protein
MVIGLLCGAILTAQIMCNKMFERFVICKRCQRKPEGLFYGVNKNVAYMVDTRNA